jgi:hypothetical protein
MSRLVLFLVLPFALLFTPFRRCLLIGPMVLAAVIGGWMANEALWEATGGQIQDGTDMSFDVHVAGTASAAFAPLWVLTVVVIGGSVIGLSFLLIRGSIRANARRLALAADVIGR